MGAASKDNVATIGAIGLVAYVAADGAHHALGHGTACLALGGRIRSLSSIFVDCSLTGSAIDLAGPFANLVVGLGAVLCCAVLCCAVLCCAVHSHCAPHIHRNATVLHPGGSFQSAVVWTATCLQRGN
jgi:hypothetical protein